MRAQIALIVSALTTCQAGAQDNGRIALCRAVKEDAVRLKCFDEATSTVRPPAPGQAKPPQSGLGAWTLQSERDRLDGSETKIPTLHARIPSLGISAELFTLCPTFGKRSFYLFLSEKIYAGRINVRYRIDDQKVEMLDARISANLRQIQIYYLEGITTAKLLKVEVMRPTQGNLLFEFDVAGVAKAITAQGCKMAVGP